MGTKVQAKDIKNQAFLTTGTAPDYEITIPRETSYADMDRMEILINFHEAGNGAITLNINGLGAKTLGISEVEADSYYTLVYDDSKGAFEESGTNLMKKDEYDSNNNGIVDNSEKLDGKSAVETLGTDNTTIPTSKAVKDVTDTKINNTEKGANNGVATLDGSGQVPTAQLPSYVDDVLEYDSQGDLPDPGETGKIYITTDNNKQYRWTGSNYVEIVSGTGNDTDAMHVNVSGEIDGIAEKTAPVDDDLVVIEDSADSNKKKKVKVKNLPGGGISKVEDDTAPKLGGNLETNGNDINLGDGDIIKIDNTIIDGHIVGVTAEGLAGGDISFGDLIYLNTDGKRYKLDGIKIGIDNGYKGMLGIATASRSAGSSSKFNILFKGYIKDSSKFSGLTNNGYPVYASDESGEVTEIKPKTDGFALRVIGFVGHEDNLLFVNVDNSFNINEQEDLMYFAGGYYDNTVYKAIERLKCSDETMSVLSNQLTEYRDESSGINSKFCGYFAGGYDGHNDVYLNNIDKLKFSDETVSVLSATLDVGITGVTGVNNRDYGYVAGGYDGANYRDIVQRLKFSDETTSTISATLSVAKSMSNRFNSTNYGYVAGGYDGTNYYDKIERLKFSDETTSTISATLSTNVAVGGGVESPSNGYVAGGYDGTNIIDKIDKLKFSDETTSTISATLSKVTENIPGANSLTNGYFAGGRIGNDADLDITDEIERLKFSDETVSVLSATLSGKKDMLSGIQNI